MSKYTLSIFFHFHFITYTIATTQCIKRASLLDCTSACKYRYRDGCRRPLCAALSCNPVAVYPACQLQTAVQLNQKADEVRWRKLQNAASRKAQSLCETAKIRKAVSNRHC